MLAGTMAKTGCNISISSLLSIGIIDNLDLNIFQFNIEFVIFGFVLCSFLCFKVSVAEIRFFCQQQVAWYSDSIRTTVVCHDARTIVALYSTWEVTCTLQ